MASKTHIDVSDKHIYKGRKKKRNKGARNKLKKNELMKERSN